MVNVELVSLVGCMFRILLILAFAFVLNACPSAAKENKAVEGVKPAATEQVAERKSEGKKFDADEFFDGCESVLVCEYTNFDEEKTIGWSNPPFAYFHIVEYLKGPPFPGRLPIRYEFHDMINKEKPEGWTFDKSMMPKKRSKWILFIPNAVPIAGAFETYHGSAGRVEFNETSYYAILDVIKKRADAPR